MVLVLNIISVFNLLSPLLCKLYNDIVQHEEMPVTIRLANISLFPKPGKDLLETTSWRPISILNNDYKIYPNILAMRLSKVVPSLIHLDQSGFVQGRLSSNNMRRLYHIIHKASSLCSPAVAISLDAERAFDRIEWPYLFFILSKFGFAPNILKWVKSLYNGAMSKPFCLHARAAQSPHYFLF